MEGEGERAMHGMKTVQREMEGTCLKRNDDTETKAGRQRERDRT